MLNDKLQISLSGITLANPIIPASGTYGFGDEFAELYDINCLGGISFKGRPARHATATHYLVSPNAATTV